MKLLPCRQVCNGPATLPDGAPQTIGSMNVPVYIYKCYGCGRVSRITSPEFSLLPDAELTPS